jgi:peptidoglycan/xylan/chitin deacetylase (PgdA/CDA1 family)
VAFGTTRQVHWAVRRAARWAKQRVTPSALILMYHRVTELPSDPQLMSVSPQHFAEHLEVMRRHARPLRLQQLAQTLQAGRVPEHGVVVTFDDGYADNLLDARPLLERFEVPATIFVTAGQLNSRQEFWWDELDRLLLQPGTRPASLNLTLTGQQHTWTLNGTAIYDAASFERHRGWHVERSDDPTPRQAVYRVVYRLLHALPAAERNAALEALRTWATLAPTGRPSHRALTIDELPRLSADDLIEIGSHTMSHPDLAGLSLADQRHEIQQSKTRLEEIVGRPVPSFAYPFGSGTSETVALVREAGHEYACSSRPDVVWSDADPLRLPRVVVRDSDGDQFARRLGYWLGS